MGVCHRHHHHHHRHHHQHHHCHHHLSYLIDIFLIRNEKENYLCAVINSGLHPGALRRLHKRHPSRKSKALGRLCYYIRGLAILYIGPHHPPPFHPGNVDANITLYFSGLHDVMDIAYIYVCKKNTLFKSFNTAVFV